MAEIVSNLMEANLLGVFNNAMPSGGH